jgi:hypothetical protein
MPDVNEMIQSYFDVVLFDLEKDEALTTRKAKTDEEVLKIAGEMLEGYPSCEVRVVAYTIASRMFVFKSNAFSKLYVEDHSVG